MKRFIVIIALIAMLIVPAAAKGSFAIGAGIEAGQPMGITVDYQYSDVTDIYAVGGFGFGPANYIDVAVGAQRNVTGFSIKDAWFDVSIGCQLGALFYFNDAKTFALDSRVTAALSYDWTWKNVGDFTAYLRGGAGLKFDISGGTSVALAWSSTLGCIYHF